MDKFHAAHLLALIAEPINILKQPPFQVVNIATNWFQLTRRLALIVGASYTSNSHNLKPNQTVVEA